MSIEYVPFYFDIQFNGSINWLHVFGTQRSFTHQYLNLCYIGLNQLSVICFPTITSFYFNRKIGILRKKNEYEIHIHYKKDESHMTSEADGSHISICANLLHVS